MQKAYKAHKKQNIYWLFVAAAAFAILTWIAKAGYLLNIEQSIFAIFQDVPKNLDVIIININHFGSTAALYSMATVTLILGHKKLGWALLYNGMGAYLLAWLMKEIIMRPRPAGLWGDVLAREGGVISYGYPSGHAAVITALVCTLWPYVAKQYRPWLIVLIIAVGLTRIILGVHAPLDILGGILVGLMIPMITSLVMRRFAR